ncbi:farnesyl-diphosphate synthase [Hasllibacter halocynthiae]|uniref:Farnesyl-diphosphate synthase n=1 Tax=Hasllibacter halocynthiae TaxID=595589 RepID=A0A2T0X2V5_9RHOB|nr:polyprenyl synthetase family protein [Hasllibacter halocynthiae]PRY93270.1 farnesyl-diphosphate synthase [Hasllibacter halocynthiae]
MPLTKRIESAMDAALALAAGADAPPRLAAALPYAVRPGGARIRPTILLNVAIACGDDEPAAADSAAAALELVHCASLVHDDLPMFDDAPLRRGKPALHAAFSEPLALLAGDALIMLAFDVLAAGGQARALGLVRLLAAYGGMPGGICAGQGWESEAKVDLSAYHRAKTGALFVAATQMGAAAAGHDPLPWEELGQRIGEAFQVADDLRDALMTEAELGKPSGQDAVHARPSAVAELGLRGAARRLDDILAGAVASIPACPGEAALAMMVRRTATRLVPADLPARIAAE